MSSQGKEFYKLNTLHMSIIVNFVYVMFYHSIICFMRNNVKFLRESSESIIFMHDLSNYMFLQR